MKHREPASPSAALSRLFDAEREVRRVSAELSRVRPRDLLVALRAAIVDARQQAEAEAALRLVRIVPLLGELEGPEAVDLLIDVLDSDVGEARWAAGEELRDLGFERFKEVALGLERALERLPDESIALVELPLVIAEIPEPGVSRLLQRFLAHPVADVVAAALEAATMVADPRVTDAVRRLVDDTRRVDMEDEEGEVADGTIGELARDAMEMFEGGAADDA